MFKLAGDSRQSITNLPQIAAFADNHYFIDKIVNKSRTKIKILKLGDSKRVEELSRMLSGMSGSEISMKHTIELFEETNKIKKDITGKEIKIG